MQTLFKNKEILEFFNKMKNFELKEEKNTSKVNLL